MRTLAPDALTDQDLKLAIDAVLHVRSRRPRIHCITNAVAQNFTANVLLAVGAVPSMTVAPDEIADFVAGADGLLVNLGTLDRERREAVEIAVTQAVKAGRPWVLDPVFVDRSLPRARLARDLTARRPAAIRLNAAEFAALASVAAGKEAAEAFALDRRCVVALSGEIDVVTDGVRAAKIENGDPLMARVTAMGCAGTALVAACLAVESDPWLGTLGALLAFAVGGECAALRAGGPGSLVVEILDSLSNLDRDTLLQRARVS
ncbi:MAG TPA: hydroxyethylthiazole kinase [Xanthobacteraceae bacterium]|jgi:hydroxyethylthiazole kinase